MIELKTKKSERRIYLGACQTFMIQKQPPEVFYKKGVL